MKGLSAFMCKVILTFVLCVWLFLPCGCGKQLGETEAEGQRRHQSVIRTNTEEMMSDIDKALLLDKPSKLTDKRIP